MIKEVLVVEGKMDVVAIDKAVEADCITTGGFTLSKRSLNDIAEAYKKRGIIILTDPDGAGERIRRPRHADPDDAECHGRKGDGYAEVSLCEVYSEGADGA